MDPGRKEYLLTAGGGARSGEIGLLTRSLHEIMAELAAGVEVPADDVGSGRAASFGRLAGAATQDQLQLRIQSGTGCPATAYATAYYRSRCFWIDDQDLHSKRIFMVLLLVTALAEAPVHQHVPVLTTSTR